MFCHSGIHSSIGAVHWTTNLQDIKHTSTQNSIKKNEEKNYKFLSNKNEQVWNPNPKFINYAWKGGNWMEERREKRVPAVVGTWLSSASSSNTENEFASFSISLSVSFFLSLQTLSTLALLERRKFMGRVVDFSGLDITHQNCTLAKHFLLVNYFIVPLFFFLKFQVKR